MVLAINHFHEFQPTPVVVVGFTMATREFIVVSSNHCEDQKFQF